MEWLLFIAVISLGVPALAWLAQERLIFFPQPVASTAHLPARASPLEVVAADGTHLRGWVVKGATTPAPAVIYFGGNAEEVSWTLADARWPRQWSIVSLNYRGYGTSEGTPGEPALTADALAIYDAVTQRQDIDPRRIVVFGRSLGTAIAVHLAAERSDRRRRACIALRQLDGDRQETLSVVAGLLVIAPPLRCPRGCDAEPDTFACDRGRSRFDHSTRTFARALRRVGRTEDMAGRARCGP